MEKMAGVELKEFYDSLSVEQLEQVLGLTKVAVEGDATPEIPDGSPVKKYLDATEKAVAKKTTPPELPTAASPTAKTASPSASQLRAIKQHLVGVGLPAALGAVGGAAVDPEHRTRNALLGAALGAGAGGALANAHTLASTEKNPYLKGLALASGVGIPAFAGTQAQHARDMSDLKKPGKAKKSTAFDQLEGKTAEKRAELVITAIRATKDAPDYVKHAAAKYVGERL